MSNQSVFPQLRVIELSAAPTVPTGTGAIYAKTDGYLYHKNDAGEETLLNGEATVTGAMLEVHIPPNSMVNLDNFFLLDGSRPITGLTTFLSTVRSYRYDASASSGVNQQFFRARGTEGTPTVNSSNDRIVVYDARAYDGSAYVNCADFEFRVDGTVSTGIVPGRWSLFIRDATGTRKEILRGNSQCRVGINQTAPSAALHPVTVDAAVPAMRAQAAASQTANIAEWVDSSSSLLAAITASGYLKLLSVPTSDPSEAGVVWSDSGTLKLSAGA